MAESEQRRLRRLLERVLPSYLEGCRWFGGHGRKVVSIQQVDLVPLGPPELAASILVLEVGVSGGDLQLLAFPVAAVGGRAGQAIEAQHPLAVVARVAVGGRPGLLVDATADRASCEALLELLDHPRVVPGKYGHLTVGRAGGYAELRGPESVRLLPRLMTAQQSNTSVVYGDRLVMKLFRRLGERPNPELEVGRVLARQGFQATPPLAAWIEYSRDARPPHTLAVVHGYIPNRGDGWRIAVASAGRFIRRRGSPRRPRTAPWPDRAAADRALGPWLASSRQLGRRVAELHQALAASREPGFRPRRPTGAFLDRLRALMETRVRASFSDLRRALPGLSGAVARQARALVPREAEAARRVRALSEIPGELLLIRCHGDLHLGQVLDTGSALLLTDFEGEPARPIRDRVRPSFALRDVAGMLRSFDYAAWTALGRQGPGTERSLALAWVARTSEAFLAAYLEVAGTARFLPPDPRSRRRLLDVFLLEKACYELGYELANRPTWLGIPLHGIGQLLDSPGDSR